MSYMNFLRTICCRLDVGPEQVAALEQTTYSFAKACNFISQVRTKTGEKFRFNLHKLCYSKVRSEFGLSANLAVQAIARVAANENGKLFEPTSVSYDERIFSFREKDWTFSLKTLGGRIRFKAFLGDYQRKHLAGKRPTSATLVKRNGKFFLNVQIKEEAKPEIVADNYLGVDLGIVNLATDSTGQQFSGKQVERHRLRRMIARKQYQRAGTKSAKRRLKKMSGRQARYQKYVNHVISKTIVEKAKALNVGIALEDLSGIRGRVEKTVGRDFRQRFGNWGFFQLRQFVEYKARRIGVPVVLVNTAYSSQTCSVCGCCSKANRPTQSVFCCKNCSFSTNADLNAALTIKAWAECKPAPKVSTIIGQGQNRCL